MIHLDATLDPDMTPAPLGLIVLQSDETLELELATDAPDLARRSYVSRIPSAAEVSTDSLLAMKSELSRAASLLPPQPLAAVGYGCTSASAVIGSEAVAEIIAASCQTKKVTNPLAATVARAADLGISRLALVSPYVEAVNQPLCAAFARHGLEMTPRGSFNIANEHAVTRISIESIVRAAIRLGKDSNAEGVFLSCTNLRTLRAIPMIEEVIGKPVISSNSALFWHLRALSH